MGRRILRKVGNVPVPHASGVLIWSHLVPRSNTKKRVIDELWDEAMEAANVEAGGAAARMLKSPRIGRLRLWKK